MSDIDQDLYELRAQLAKGGVQNAYVALVSYMSRLRTRYVGERGQREVSGLYQGCFDMTYFALFPHALRGHNLKVAVVFDYATFSFQTWLAVAADAGRCSRRPAGVSAGVGRETVHVHSEAVHVPVPEDANGTRPRETGRIPTNPLPGILLARPRSR